MLDLQPARRRSPPSHRRFGLALAGGGPLGAFYEVGTLHAIGEAFESAQESVQSRLGSARDQATETWDNLEALFQSRVHKAMNQLGVPTAEEIRVLTRRVAELNDTVKTLSAKQARAKRAAGKSKAKRGARAKTSG